MPLSPKTILLVDDDREFAAMVAQYLNQDGFETDRVNNGEAALEYLRRRPVDAIVLDIMIPRLSGHEVLQRVRKEAGAPRVLILTAKGDEVDRVIGLESGADDYLAKPCSLRELAARLRAILRRAETPAIPFVDAPITAVGALAIDRLKRTAALDGEALSLTDAEYMVLCCLADAVGTSVSREVLMHSALGRRYRPHDRSIDVHVANLRRKLARRSKGDASLIRTIRGAGYMLIPQPD
ncbi:MAG: response regulator transcription factor [Pseudomonadota bacterium]